MSFTGRNRDVVAVALEVAVADDVSLDVPVSLVVVVPVDELEDVPVSLVVVVPVDELVDEPVSLVVVVPVADCVVVPVLDAVDVVDTLGLGISAAVTRMLITPVSCPVPYEFTPRAYVVDSAAVQVANDCNEPL